MQNATHITEAADRYAKGDRSVPQTDIVIALLREANRDIKALDRRYSLYAFNILGKWIDELTNFGRFRGIPLRETYTRLAYLLGEDLYAYLGSRDQAATKARWVDAHRLPATSLSRLDAPTLRAYLSFVRAVQCHEEAISPKSPNQAN